MISNFSKRLLVASLILNIIFCACAGYFIYKRGGISYVTTRISMVTGTGMVRNTDTPYYNDKKSLFEILPKTNRSIIFIGDSITDGCEWSELLQNPNIKNRGIGSDTTYGVLKRLDNIIQSEPEKVFLMIGINDLGRGESVSEITSNYDKILERLTKNVPNSEVFVQSVLPISKQKLNTQISNEKVRSLNKEIKQLSQKYNLIYIDLYSLMISEDDQLISGLTNDGIHLNGSGYEIWRNAIQQYIK